MLLKRRKVRNRTVSGQMGSPLTMRYHSPIANKQATSSRGISSKTSILKSVRLIIKWLLTRTGLVIVVGAAIYWGILVDPSPKVLVAKGDQYRPSSSYLQVVNSQVSKLKDSTKVTFDSDAITSALTKAFPEVASASVELPFIGRQPVVRVNIVAPALNLTDSSSQSYVVSATGQVVGQASQLLPLKDLPLINDQSGEPVTVGDQLLSVDQVSFIKVLIAQSQYAHVLISGFVLPSTPQELDVQFTGKAYYAKFYMGGDPVGQAGSLFALLHYMQAHHITPAKYVDVRVSGKVFYK